jgi:hypothetical protein
MIVPVPVLSESSTRGKGKIDKSLININFESSSNIQHLATGSSNARHVSSRVSAAVIAERCLTVPMLEAIVLLGPIPLPSWFVGGSK